MTRYKTTVDFIHICKDFTGRERLKKLAGNLGLELDDLKKYEGDIDTITEDVKEIDTKFHELEPKDNGRCIFLGETLHAHLASDLR